MAADRDTHARPDPRVNAWRADLAAEHLRGEVDVPHYVKGETFTVKVASTALRHAPSHGAAMDTQLLYGEDFRVYDKRGIWVWGQAGYDDYVGYVLAQDLEKPQSPTHIISALRSFTLVDADVKSCPVMMLSMGAKLHIPNIDEADIEARFAQLHDGSFVPCGHIVPIGCFENDIIGVARRFLGVPYLWGGRESLGLDCSALVQLVLMRCGYACPRDSDMQEAVLGKIVETAQKGDLVFWQGHVGLMSENDILLHANASHMMVVEENFADACTRIKKSDGAITSIRRLS